MKNNRTVNLTIPSDRGFISVARLTTSALANKIGFDIEDIDDMKIVVSEACKYVIAETKKDFVEIDFFIHNNDIEFEVKDTKESFLNSDAPEVNIESKDHPEVYIIESMVNEFKAKKDNDNILIYMKKKFI